MKREEAIKMLKQLVNMLSDDFGDSELCEEALQWQSPPYRISRCGFR